MNDDYLWDGSGEPDPEVQRLERLLRRFQGKPGASGPAASKVEAPDEEVAEQTQSVGSRIGGTVDSTAGRETPRLVAPPSARAPSTQSDRDHGIAVIARSRRRAAAFVGAIAAAILLAAAGIVLLRSGRLGVSGASGWDVVALAGEPTLGSRPMPATGTLLPGEWIETDDHARAEIRIGSIGRAEIEPRTRVRLIQAGTIQHRLGLARGTIHARIWAPPRLFFIETPSAVAVDLGCAYTLTVDDDGGSRLRVESGWVAFEEKGAESFVPAGAICRTAPGRPPGTPYFEDAAPAFIEALARIDLDRVRNDPGDGTSSGEGGGASAPQRSALADLLDSARTQDALTLWHLLSRTEAEDRARVFDRMALLVPPPVGVTRAGILAGDRGMADLWWDELGLGVTSWWRLWKQPGPPKLE